jgi:hypothetical protein
MKRNVLGLGIQFAAAATLAAFACLPAAAVEATPTDETPVVQPAVVADTDESADTCLNYTPVQPTDEKPVLLAALIQPAAGTAVAKKPCRACPNQPWCACTYNGYPRVSCDPCCYTNPYTGQQICTS